MSDSHRPVRAGFIGCGGLNKMFMPANRKAAELIRRNDFDASLLLAQYPQIVRPSRRSRFTSSAAS